MDNAAAANAARDILYGLRKNADHKGAARQIGTKHGSRKAAIPMTGGKTKTGRKTPSDKQLTLEF